MKVYLDNGGTTKVDDKIAKEVYRIMTVDYGNPSSVHSVGEESKLIVEKARESVAKRVKALPEEIMFTAGGTESNNLAINSLIDKKKNHIITTGIEHPSVRETCKNLANQGYTITFLKPSEEGIITAKQIEVAITPKTSLVSIMHANNEIGVVQDIDAIGKVCKKKKVNFHVDAVQSFTKVDIDVKNVDAMSFSSHKVHGPKGVGALYMRKGLKIKRLFFGGHQERNLRAGTENVPGIHGFGLAAKEKQPIGQIKKLRDRLIKKVLEIPDTFLNGSKERLCNNANITFKHIEGEALLMHLDMKGISVSTGSACSSRTLEPSHVLLALGLKHEEAHGSIRFTLSKYTTEKEIDYTVSELKKIVKKLREISPLGK
jgi:cysteine desulfurase